MFKTFLNYTRRNEHRYNVIGEVTEQLNMWRDFNDERYLRKAIAALQAELTNSDG